MGHTSVNRPSRSNSSPGTPSSSTFSGLVSGFPSSVPCSSNLGFNVHSTGPFRY
ncbi:hypothetical protein PILCRDRAFT_809904 [Piloderma croceum F 1598]|uniref:Uncharacterized protein n=1 Tax=Piloderma croceum (strain F 1598) TaxID=765440 RepID=A0A0C3G6L7_PILCF|nr:hypothetical protein PILCRDRAFT_809904 [Piloderma croceum F 1598]